MHFTHGVLNFRRIAANIRRYGNTNNKCVAQHYIGGASVAGAFISAYQHTPMPAQVFQSSLQARAGDRYVDCRAIFSFQHTPNARYWPGGEAGPRRRTHIYSIDDDAVYISISSIADLAATTLVYFFKRLRANIGAGGLELMR